MAVTLLDEMKMTPETKNAVAVIGMLTATALSVVLATVDQFVPGTYDYVLNFLKDLAGTK